MSRILSGRRQKLRFRLEDENGTLVNADNLTNVTVDVRDGDDNIIAGGSGSIASNASEFPGVYAFEIPSQTNLDVLEATWTATQGGSSRTVKTLHEVVGSRLVELWRLKEDTELSSLTGESLRRLEENVEDEFHSAIGFAPFRRPFRLEVESAGGPRLLLPFRKVGSVISGKKPDGTALTSAELDRVRIRHGRWLEISDGANFEKGYWTFWLTHGLEYPPEELRRVAVVRARYLSRKTDIPERASQLVTQGAIINLELAESDHPTGLPDVDVVLVRLRERSLSF